MLKTQTYHVVVNLSDLQAGEKNNFRQVHSNENMIYLHRMYLMVLDQDYASLKKQLEICCWVKHGILEETGPNLTHAFFISVTWILIWTAPFEAHIFTTLSERAICMAFYIFSEAPSTERAPRKGPRGQLLYTCFFPSPILSLAHSLALFALLCSTDAFYLMFFHCDLSHTTIFTLYSFLSFSSCLSSSWMLMTLISPQLSQDYRLQGAREALHSQRTQIYPTCSAMMPGNQAKFFCFFFFLEKGAQQKCSVHKPAKADFPNFCLVVVKFWGKLATSWPLPQMLRPSEPTWINISS